MKDLLSTSISGQATVTEIIELWSTFMEQTMTILEVYLIGNYDVYLHKTSNEFYKCVVQDARGYELYETAEYGEESQAVASAKAWCKQHDN